MSRRSLRYLPPLAALTLFCGLACSPSAGPPAAASNAAVAARPVGGPPRPAHATDFTPHKFDWPQWQGPDRTAVSRETGLLREWRPDGPRLVWEADYVGEGYSTPTVAAGRLFLMGNRDGKECVLALSEADGGELWASVIGPAVGVSYPGPRCSPTVDGDRVYALGVGGDLVCLATASGSELWRKSLRKDFGGGVGGWGYSESPLVDGDRLLFTPGGGKATVVAVKKMTGETVWQAKVPNGDQAAYSSIVAADFGGQREYIQFLAGGVVGLSADGKFLWRYAKPSAGINCMTPVYRDGIVYAAAEYNKGGGAARLTREKDAVTATELYFSGHYQNHHGGMVLVDGYLYGEGTGQMACVEFKTGREMWRERKAGKGSVAAADGRIYYRSEGGTIVLVEASPKQYVEHGRFTPAKTSGLNAWPHPVIANGKLYLRDQQYLFCYDLKPG